MKNSIVQDKMQKFGRFLSGMVIPNIGAFIAWGLLTALFIPTGWMPNEYLAAASTPMVKWLIPLLISYSGGSAIYMHRGGVVGAIATAGIIAGSEIPMFLGAMIMGPFGGWCIKMFDKFINNKIPIGFEMLVNNFSSGILGAILALLAYDFIGPFVSVINDILTEGVQWAVNIGFIPLVAIITEPAKVLFLNNAIDHGIFDPIAIQQSQEVGKSLFFLIITNPGPGLGMLLAFCLAGKGTAKSSAPGAIIIHFLGGIHEIYFPYVLMKPILLLAIIPAGMAGLFVANMMGGGLIAPASPGSIFAILAMTPKGAYLANIMDVFVATVVSFIISYIFLKSSKNDSISLETAKENIEKIKNNNKIVDKAIVKEVNIKKIVYACDAGMGSSAMGASALRNKLTKEGYGDIVVMNCAIGDIPKDAQIVVSHERLADRAIADSPQAEHIFVKDFINNDVFETIISKMNEIKTNEDIKKENIKIGLKTVSKEKAIEMAGELLFESGYVEREYIQGMLNREKDISTYMGRGIAIPHGENVAKKYIKKSGIVVLQFPDGIDFGSGKAKLIIGVAGKGNEHLSILANIAIALDEYTDRQLEEIFTTKNKDEIYKLFMKK